MPAYVSHTIMAKDVYNKINNKNVNLDYMLTYSLGGDLCKYAKCRYDSHHKKQEEFIYNICDYMKENNLTKDSECLGFLYGHICHLMMDQIIHPVIRTIDKSCIKNKNNHTMIELYYDNYLSKNKFNNRIDKYDNRVINAKSNKKISNMINSVYLKTYNCKNISFYYKFNLFLYRRIKLLYKLFSFNFLKKISGMNKFLNNNRNCFNKKVCNDLDKSYDKSVKESIDFINKVNKYLNII